MDCPEATLTSNFSRDEVVFSATIDLESKAHGVLEWPGLTSRVKR